MKKIQVQSFFDFLNEYKEFDNILNESELLKKFHLAFGSLNKAEMIDINKALKRYKKVLIERDVEFVKFDKKLKNKDLDKVDRKKIEELRKKKNEYYNSELVEI